MEEKSIELDMEKLKNEVKSRLIPERLRTQQGSTSALVPAWASISQNGGTKTISNLEMVI